MSYFRWTPDRLDLLTKLYLSEAPPHVIAKCLKTDLDEVRWKIEKLNLQRSSTGRRSSSAQWTEERVERLTALWMQGKSFSEIARDLGRGLTRNAVCGKIHRLGLAGRVKVVREPARRRKKKTPETPISRPTKMRALLEVLPLPPEAKTDTARKFLIDLEKADCRWPVGDPKQPDFGFCADERLPGSSYCHRHTLRAFHLPKVPERVAAHIQENIQVDSETQTKVEEFAD